jgi:glycosyltransferase involved in cell wall biosynthesis
LSDQKPILLSVGITSHNHEKQIARAIESVLSQNTDYRYELIICDDSSTDGTQKKIIQYAEANPLVIITSFNIKNEGPLINGSRFFSLASGKYLCWLDADDCWIYNKKIQKQIDFLEANPEYSGCFHDAAIISDIPEGENSEEFSMRFHNHWKTYSQFNTYQPDFSPWDALMRKIVPTASLVFRKTDMSAFFEKFKEINLSISWAVHLWLLKNGIFKYFNEVWSEYHDHPEGFSKKYSLIDFKINNINILELFLQDDYYRQLSKDVYKALVQEYFHLLSLPDINKINKSDFAKYMKAYNRYSKLALKTESEHFQKNYKGLK